MAPPFHGSVPLVAPPCDLDLQSPLRSAARPAHVPTVEVTSRPGAGRIDHAPRNAQPAPAWGCPPTPADGGSRDWGSSAAPRGHYRPSVRIEHTALIVENYDDAIRFFVDALGFVLAEDSPATTNDGRPRRWVVVRPPEAQTGLLLAEADGKEQVDAIGRTSRQIGGACSTSAPEGDKGDDEPHCVARLRLLVEETEESNVTGPCSTMAPRSFRDADTQRPQDPASPSGCWLAARRSSTIENGR